MIFVSTGTLPLPFARLIDTTIDYFQQIPDQKVIIQTGVYQPPYSFPKHIITKPYFSFNQTIKYYQTANLIISAAGEASVFLILKYANNKPIFVPRLKSFHEHVDNKQLATCNYLKKRQLAKIAIKTHQLTKLLQQKPSKLNQHPKTFLLKSPELNKLINHLHSVTR